MVCANGWMACLLTLGVDCMFLVLQLKTEKVLKVFPHSVTREVLYSARLARGTDRL